MVQGSNHLKTTDDESLSWRGVGDMFEAEFESQTEKFRLLSPRKHENPPIITQNTQKSDAASSNTNHPFVKQCTCSPGEERVGSSQFGPRCHGNAFCCMWRLIFVAIVHRTNKSRRFYNAAKHCQSLTNCITIRSWTNKTTMTRDSRHRRDKLTLHPLKHHCNSFVIPHFRWNFWQHSVKLPHKRDNSVLASPNKEDNKNWTNSDQQAENTKAKCSWLHGTFEQLRVKINSTICHVFPTLSNIYFAHYFEVSRYSVSFVTDYFQQDGLKYGSWLPYGCRLATAMFSQFHQDIEHKSQYDWKFCDCVIRNRHRQKTTKDIHSKAPKANETWISTEREQLFILGSWRRSCFPGNVGADRNRKPGDPGVNHFLGCLWRRNFLFNYKNEKLDLFHTRARQVFALFHDNPTDELDARKKWWPTTSTERNKPREGNPPTITVSWPPTDTVKH